MKRFIFMFIAVLTALILTGCPGTGQDPDPVTYTVTYNSNSSDSGAAPTDSSTYEEGAIVTVADAGTMARTDYTFAGWNTAPDGSGTSHAAGSTLTMGTADVTLYSWWTNDLLESLSYRDMVSVPGGTFLQGKIVSSV